MAGYVTCHLKECGEQHSVKIKKELTIEEVTLSSGKIKRWYYCNDDHYNKQKEIEKNTEREQKELDEINQVVKKIYGIGEKYNIPSRWWSVVQDLRNGTNRYQKFWKRRYKKGIPYPVIAEAFRLSKDNIRWANMNKKFKSIDQELNYGLVIMQSKLIDAERKLTKTKIEEKRSKEIEKVQLEFMEDNRDVVYKKQETKDDYSYLLGDD